MNRLTFATLHKLFSASAGCVHARLSRPLVGPSYPIIPAASSRKDRLSLVRALSAAASQHKAMAPTPKLAPADLPNPYAHELCAPPSASAPCTIDIPLSLQVQPVQRSTSLQP